MAKTPREPAMIDLLRRAIQKSGQSLNQLSKACGVDRSRLSRFLRGERDLTLTAAGRVCETLGITLSVPPEIDVAAGEPTKPAPKKARGKPSPSKER